MLITRVMNWLRFLIKEYKIDSSSQLAVPYFSVLLPMLGKLETWGNANEEKLKEWLIYIQKQIDIILIAEYGNQDKK